MLNPDFTAAEGETLEGRYGITVFDDLDAAFATKPDLAVIATPSALHLEPMQKAIENNCGVFVEKPWSHNLDGFAALECEADSRGLPFFISFQRRHHPYLSRIHELTASGALGPIVNAVFNVASYVPAWHQYEDYRDLYAVRAALGGGVLLTEIHEIDLACWWFGLPDTVFCSGGTYGEDKSIDVEDTAHVTLRYADFDAQVNLCFMQRVMRRDLFVAGTKGYAAWNQNANTFVHEDYESGEVKRESDPGFTNDGMFINQARAFLDDHGATASAKQWQAAYAAQAVVEAAKASMRNGAAVAPPGAR